MSRLPYREVYRVPLSVFSAFQKERPLPDNFQIHPFQAMYTKAHSTPLMYNCKSMLLNRMFSNPADTGATVKAKQ